MFDVRWKIRRVGIEIKGAGVLEIANEGQKNAAGQ
jgi:hypothetical protein